MEYFNASWTAHGQELACVTFVTLYCTLYCLSLLHSAWWQVCIQNVARIKFFVSSPTSVYITVSWQPFNCHSMDVCVHTHSYPPVSPCTTTCTYTALCEDTELSRPTCTRRPGGHPNDEVDTKCWFLIWCLIDSSMQVNHLLLSPVRRSWTDFWVTKRDQSWSTDMFHRWMW